MSAEILHCEKSLPFSMGFNCREAESALKIQMISTWHLVLVHAAAERNALAQLRVEMESERMMRMK